MPTNWYLVFTRPKWEEKVVDSLLRKGIESYYPYNKVVSVQCNSRKIIYKPLFANYVFVRLNVLRLGEVKKIDGVLNLVYWLDKPAIIRDVEIEMMRRFLNEHANVQLEKTFVNASGMVKIVNGALTEKEGSNLGISSNNVKLVLPSLGYSLFADVNTENVEILIQDDPIQYKSSSIENTLNYGL